MGGVRGAAGKLTERSQQKSTHRVEVSRLARAYQQARIRAWFREGETRLTQYLPVGGDARDSRGNPAGETPFSEDRLHQGVHPEDRERLALAWNRAHEDHLAYDVEYRVLQDDGTVRYQYETATPEFDEAGCYLGHVGITQDISQQRRAERALRESEARLTQVQNIAKIGHVIWDEIEGR